MTQERTENIMSQNLENFINRYNTPRIFQIFSTISYIALSVLMFTLDVFEWRDPFVLYSNTFGMKVFRIFYWNFNSDNGVERFVEIIAVVAAIVGIVFVWLNRPKASGICSGALAVIMLLSLLRMYDFEDYYVQTSILGGTSFYIVSVKDAYYILWGVLTVLIVFTILSIMFTKQGPRQPKAVTIVEVPQQISLADEIKKYKDLLDSGTITQEEFDAKKKEILEK